MNERNITSLEYLTAVLGENPGVLVYFSTSDCSVCKVLKPKVKTLLKNEFPEMTFAYVDSEVYPEISAQHNVFTAPTLLVFFAGKETVRKSRHIGIDELREAIQRPYRLMFGGS